MTAFETILRLSEMKGRLSHIMLQEVSDVKREISELIQDLSEDFLSPAGTGCENNCDHDWRIIQDKACLSGTSLFCRYCGERDE